MITVRKENVLATLALLEGSNVTVLDVKSDSKYASVHYVKITGGVGDIFLCSYLHNDTVKSLYTDDPTCLPKEILLAPIRRAKRSPIKPVYNHPDAYSEDTFLYIRCNYGPIIESRMRAWKQEAKTGSSSK